MYLGSRSGVDVDDDGGKESGYTTTFGLKTRRHVTLTQKGNSCSVLLFPGRRIFQVQF
jgi:hypothetical protein